METDEVSASLERIERTLLEIQGRVSRIEGEFTGTRWVLGLGVAVCAAIGAMLHGARF